MILCKHQYRDSVMPYWILHEHMCAAWLSCHLRSCATASFKKVGAKSDLYFPFNAVCRYMRKY